ncbi:MAG: RluA family pseudouridine synthase [Planctomycetota bacterium]|nr:RluA family pseudouridine synthase [Planctomycetota bacterium]
MTSTPDGPHKQADPAEDHVINGGGKVDASRLHELYETLTDDDGPIAVTFTLSRDLNKRLDRYLVDRIPFLSRTSLQRLIAEDAVQVNGRTPKASTRLRRNDVVTVAIPPPPSSVLPADEMPLEILYEDRDFLILNKQDDVIVHPARGNQRGTLVNGLAWHCSQQSSGNLSDVGREEARPGVVHRLDRHTTGVMVFAKSDTAHWRLGRQFEQRRTRKRYLALVHGKVEPRTDVIDVPLGKHLTIRDRYAVRWDDSGKEAITIFRVRECYKDFTLVELELRTGRTHQIRVHLSHLGWPIAGDDYYGGRHLFGRDIFGPGDEPDMVASTPILTRQALHAGLLGFAHPLNDEPVTFTAPLPEDLRTVIHLLRKYQFVSRPKVPGTELDLEMMLGTENSDEINEA